MLSEAEFALVAREVKARSGQMLTPEIAGVIETRLQPIARRETLMSVGELIAAGRVAPAGLAAFARRDEKRSEVYSYERKMAELDGTMLSRFQGERAAWQWFSAQAPWYRRAATHWVTSAKRPETREKRLGTLISCSEKKERIPPLRPSPGA